MKNKKILFIGKRLDAIKTALDAGFEVYVLSFKKPKFKSKKYFEVLYSENFQSLAHIEFDVVLPLTEKSVPVAYDFLKSRALFRQDIEKYRICHNKLDMKNFAKAHDIPIAEFREVAEPTEIEQCIEKWKFPVVLKEINNSGSRGQIVIHNPSQIPKKLEHKMLTEKWIEGYEFSVESLIFQGEVIFQNITDYYVHHHCNVLPAEIRGTKENQITKFNQGIIKKFGIQNGIAHIEYFQTRDGILFGEMAVRPPGGYIMRLIELAYGFSPWRALIDIEAGTRPFIYTTPSYWSGVWIIHPGECVIEKEPDFLHIINNQSVVDIKCGLKKGMKIPKREGSGQDYGRILLKSKEKEEIYSLIDLIRKRI